MCMSEHAVNQVHGLSHNVAEIRRLHHINFSANFSISIFSCMVVDNFDLYTYTFKSLKLLTVNLLYAQMFPPWKLMII